MKLWRKKILPDGASILEEVPSVDAIDTDKPVVFILPGRDFFAEKETTARTIAGNIKHMNRLLGTTEADPEAEILVVSYDIQPDGAKALYANQRMDLHHDDEAEALVKDFIAPLQAKGSNPTLYGYSFGTIFADNVRAELIRQYRRARLPDSDIAEKVQDICLVASTNVSRAVSPGVPDRENDLDFTSVFFAFANDRMAEMANPVFEESKRPHHEEGKVSFTQLTGNRLQIMGDAPDSLKVWKESKGKIAFTTIVDKDPEMRPLNHSNEFMVYRGKAEDVELLAPYQETVLRNAVRRESGIKVDDLLKAPATRLSKLPICYVPFTGTSGETQRIRDGLANKQPWTQRVQKNQTAEGQSR